MGQPTVFDADWLQVLAALRPDEHAAAALAFGLPAPQAPSPEAKRPPREVPVTPPTQIQQPEPPEPPREQPLYWRVAAQHDEPAQTQPPAWWAATAPATAADYATDAAWQAPSVRSLIPAPRWAAFLKQAVAARVPGPELNLPRLISQLAGGHALARLPRQAVRRWPRRLLLACHAPGRLGPLGFDLSRLSGQTHALLGTRVTTVTDAQALQLALARRDAPLLLLSDLGCLGGSAAEQAHWRALLGAAKPGGQALVLVSADASPAATALLRLPTGSAAFAVADDRPLRRLRREPGALAAAPALTAPEASPARQALQAALLGNSNVSSDLLRALRRCLAGQGLALGLASEVQVWTDPGVRQDGLACVLAAAAQADAQAVFSSLDPRLREQVAALHWRHIGSPLLRAAYARRVLPLLAPGSAMANTLAQADAQAEQAMRRLARAMAADPQGEVWRQTAGFIGDLARRSPDLYDARSGDGWLTAWATAHQLALAQGTAEVPPDLPWQRLAWLEGSAQVGRLLGLRARVLHAAGMGASTVSQLSLVDLAGSDGDSGSGLAALPAASYARWQPLPDTEAQDRHAARALMAWAATQRLETMSSLMFYLRASAMQATQGQRGSDAESPNSDLPSPDRSPSARDAIDGAAFVLAEWLMRAPLDDLSDERAVLEFKGWRRCVGADSPGPLVDALRPHLPDDLLAQADLQPAPPPAQARMQPVAQALVLPHRSGPLGRIDLQVGPRRLQLQPFTRPAWAEWLEHDGRHWLAGTARGDRLQWRPAGLRFAVSSGEGLAHYTLPHAAWWALDADGGDWRQDQAVNCPSWATRHGVDEHGYWAEFGIQKLVQRMRFIRPGRFWMGSPLAEAGRFDNETLHPVTITRGYWLADSACTWTLWQAVTGQVPDGQARAHRTLPVVNISHDDITRQFLPQLNRQLPGFEGRLPGEAEWEHAARAGTATAYPWGDQPDAERMNYGGIEKKGAGRSLPVRDLAPNAWGLHQMHGNVWEWCADGSESYPPGEALDPLAEQAASRVLRGGSWIGGARYCRSALRLAYVPGFRGHDFGFRLARGLPQAGRAEPGGRGAPVLPAEPAGFAGPGGAAPGPETPKPPPGLWSEVKRLVANLSDTPPGKKPKK